MQLVEMPGTDICKTLTEFNHMIGSMHSIYLLSWIRAVVLEDLEKLLLPHGA